MTNCRELKYFYKDLSHQWAVLGADVEFSHSVAINDGVEVLIVAIKVNDWRVSRLVAVAVFQNLLSGLGPENLAQPRGWIFRKIRNLWSVLDTTTIDYDSPPVISLYFWQIFFVFLFDWNFLQLLADSSAQLFLLVPRLVLTREQDWEFIRVALLGTGQDEGKVLLLVPLSLNSLLTLRLDWNLLKSL